MKKTLFCTSLMFLTFLSTTASPTWRETRKVLFTPPVGTKTFLLNPGESLAQKVDFQLATMPSRRFLRVVGGVKFPAPYTQRGETKFRAAEFLIDDCLDSLQTLKDTYSLYFKGEDDPFERLAFQRIPGAYLKSGELTVTLPVVKKEQLAIKPEGWFGLEIDLYFKKKGRDANDIYDSPDSVLYVPIPAGSGGSELLTRKFTLPENVACAFLQVGGTHFGGECWIEAPRFSQQHTPVCHIPFTKYEQRTDSLNYWVGSNLSTRSWPKWKLETGGRTIYEGTIFDRASNVADFYIPLPVWVADDSELRLHLLKDGARAAFPYEIHRLELIEETARPYEVIAVPRYVSQQSSFGALVETNEPHVTLQVHASGAVSPTTQTCTFDKPGLHVVEFRAQQAGDGVQLTFSDGKREESAEVSQIIEKDAERIYVSSGDEIYIDKEYTPYNYFFKWYHHNRVGNWYQFRPSYQWSGFRIANPELIGHYTHLLDQLQVPYAWQVEGRTLASSQINPPLSVLASPLFRGKQAHENDGGYYYWNHFHYEGLFSDVAARNRPYGGIFAKHRPIVTDHGTFIHYDTAGIKDMADGARTFVDHLRYSKGESTRHTGPSSLFRYFYQAGYKWLGAEQMYGPEETILSSLRGASRAYDRSEYGTLHAMQWSSGPFADPKHSLRLYLSLALAYMHGSSHMNTEEALWTDEYANDRYSEGGKEHLFAQHQVLDFVETHTRRGELKSNVAVIQGRNDAWKSFMRTNLWSQKGEAWKFDTANESFDLMQVFYPHNVMNACGPHGWFSETPYGTVDLLPIEASREAMERYKALIFLGWNSYDEADFTRLYDFVYQGGTLLLTAAHINEEGMPNVSTRFPRNDEAVRRLLGEGYQQLTDKRVRALGNGKVIYFPQKVYPADSSIREAYEEAMREVTKEVTEPEHQRGWISNNPEVGFTAWDQGNRRTIYLLNVDWKSIQKVPDTENKLNKDFNVSVYNADKEYFKDENCLERVSFPETHYGVRPVSFVFGTHTFEVLARRYHMETIHCAEGLAVLPSSNTTDILSIERIPGGWLVKVQTTGADTFRCMRKTNGRESTISVDRAGITVLKIELE